MSFLRRQESIIEMKRLIIYNILLICVFSCKNKNQERVEEIEVVEIIKDSVVKKVIPNINFNKPPIKIKDYTLNDKGFWVTSSMIDAKYLKDSFCSYKNYNLQRRYNVISKSNSRIKNQLEVYVSDDEFKWNREKANEEFFSMKINDEAIKLWNQLYVGMHKDSLLSFIKFKEYHEDFGSYVVYSDKYESNFYFENDTIQKIEIKRRNCQELSDLNEYLVQNKLDSLYKISYEIIPNYLKADFDGDGKEDITLLIKEIQTKKIGLVFIHKNNSYFTVGAGEEYKANNDDLNWIDILKLDLDKDQHETIIDEETHDILGDKSITIPNIGISIREIEGSGGLLYFSGSKYEYLHQGD